MVDDTLEDPLTSDHPDVPASPSGYDDSFEYVAAPSWFNLALGEIGMFILSIEPVQETSTGKLRIYGF
jgi:hypothetical protein